MRTYTEFMNLVEQIPHNMPTTPVAVQKARISASRRQRIHVHNELEREASRERKDRSNLDQFA